MCSRLHSEYRNNSIMKTPRAFLRESTDGYNNVKNTNRGNGLQDMTKVIKQVNNKITNVINIVYWHRFNKPFLLIGVTAETIS